MLHPKRTTSRRRVRRGQNPTRNEKEKAREAINAYLKAKMETGTARDRADLVTALREDGLDFEKQSTRRSGSLPISQKKLDILPFALLKFLPRHSSLFASRAKRL